MTVDGILNINKPRGMTSHDVVGMVRRLSGQKRVGHAGTLDPLAEGVLIVALGRSTRLIEYMMESTKVYCAEIVLGATTTTYDSEGDIVATKPVEGVTLSKVEEALASLTGPIKQLPPMYSAIKQGGQRLYELARRGIEVERQPRDVNVHRVGLLDWQCPVLKVELVVSKGTYIRSFAYDLGEKLGVGAYLNYLVRVASGRFNIKEALTPDDLRLAVELGYWQDLLYSPDEGMLNYDAVILDESRSAGVLQGRGWPARLPLREAHEYGPTRAYSQQGHMIAVVQLNRESGWWQPRKVLA